MRPPCPAACMRPAWCGRVRGRVGSGNAGSGHATACQRSRCGGVRCGATACLLSYPAGSIRPRCPTRCQCVASPMLPASGGVSLPASTASPCDISPTVSGGRGGDSWGMLSHACQWSRCQPSGHRPAWCGRMPWGFVGMLPHAVLLPACYGVRHGVASPMPASPCHAVPPSGVWSSLPACYGVRRPIAWLPIPLRIPHGMGGDFDTVP